MALRTGHRQYTPTNAQDSTWMYRHRCTPVFARTMSTTLRIISSSRARSGESRPARVRARVREHVTATGSRDAGGPAPRFSPQRRAQRAGHGELLRTESVVHGAQHCHGELLHPLIAHDLAACLDF
jgi:hypothetical protein